jgi:hypothetical protein
VEGVEMVVGGLASHARTPPMDARTTSGSSANWSSKSMRAVVSGYARTWPQTLLSWPRR